MIYYYCKYVLQGVDMRNTKDVRVIRTQTALLEALEVLIQKKKLSAITITDLCNQAKINRNTFYYHYNNIYEFLDEHKKQVIADIHRIADSSKKHDKSCLLELCNSIKYHPHFLNILISPNCDIDYFNDIFQAATKVTCIFEADIEKVVSPRIKYLYCYSNAGANEVLYTWLRSGMQEPPDLIADVIWDAANNGPLTLIK